MSPSPNETQDAKITIRPPQFGLRTLLLASAGIAMTFGVLRWFKVSAAVGFFVLAVLIVAALAAAGLVAAMLQAYTRVESAGDVENNEGDSSDPLEREEGDRS